MNKHKVLLLGKLPPPFIGPSIATEILLNSKLKEDFILLHLDTKLNTELDSFGKWSFSKITKNGSLYRKMYSLLKREKPALVLIPISQTATGFLKDSLFIFIAVLFRRKIILQLRGSDFKNWTDHSFFLNKWFVKLVLKTTNGVIVLGEKLKYLFEDHFSSNKIFVVPNGGNYEIPAKRVSGKVKVLYLANLLKSKGVTDVVRAIEILYRDEKLKDKFSVDLVGAWFKEEDKKECEALITVHHLPVTIHPPKGKEEKLQFLADADIFVFPPREPEGHPWSIVEAMAAALPVISTDKGAITESVKNNVNGFIIKASDPGEIAEKLRLLITDENMRKTQGAASHALYLANFTEEKMVKKLTAVFNEVINE